MRRAALMIVVLALAAAGSADAADHFSFTAKLGSTPVHEARPLEDWMGLARDSLGVQFRDLQSPSIRAMLGWEVWAGTRMRASLEAGGEYRWNRGEDRAGNTWEAWMSAFNVEALYLYHLVPADRRVVPYVGIGTGYKGLRFTLAPRGAKGDSLTTPGSLSAGRGFGYLALAGGTEIKLSRSFGIGLRAEYHFAPRVRMQIESTGTAGLDARVFLPTAESWRHSAANPDAWSYLEYDPKSLNLMLSLHWYQHLTRAPGLAGP